MFSISKKCRPFPSPFSSPLQNSISLLFLFFFSYLKRKKAFSFSKKILLPSQFFFSSNNSIFSCSKYFTPFLSPSCLRVIDFDLHISPDILSYINCQLADINSPIWFICSHLQTKNAQMERKTCLIKYILAFFVFKADSPGSLKPIRTDLYEHF